ncbi:hypothetical protein TL16_g11461 [Triparma laevis f. inornata]|uniref:Uncharacterized protein n=1 Tax=Triparma laevis f. inornata TaxID=1714386 RepID=A0A9W7BF79_9STRA|nr:hypothetical protein TL16_g11461 [Triparma laevis f. inornata]
MTNFSTAPAAIDEFMFTNDFRRLLGGFFPDDTLISLISLRLATKAWKVVAEEVIDEGIESGAMMVHDGKDISDDAAYDLQERRELVTRVIFLLNITKVGKNECMYAINLVVVDTPDGVERIGNYAFWYCSSLTDNDVTPEVVAHLRSQRFAALIKENAELKNQVASMKKETAALKN